MEAKDTVMSDAAIRGSCLGEGLYFGGELDETGSSDMPILMPQFRRIALAQTEISFEAGYKQAKEDMDIQLVSLAELCLSHRKAGIKELMEWVIANEPRTIFVSEQQEFKAKWQAKLKEWGL